VCLRSKLPRQKSTTSLLVHVAASSTSKNYTQLPGCPKFLDPQSHDCRVGSGGKAETLRKDTGADDPQNDAFELGEVSRLHHRQAVHQPPARVANVLQRTPAEAAEALDVTADCRVDGRPLIVRFKEVWVLSPTALALLEADGSGARRTSDLLPYRRPGTALLVAPAHDSLHSFLLR